MAEPSPTRPELSPLAGVRPANTHAEDSTAFAVPVATHVLERPRLYERLRVATSAPLTLVAGPAGWGKTLLVGSWVTADAEDRTVAWVNLDPRDDDPRAFWTAVAAAVGSGAGEATATALRRLRAHPSEPDLPGMFAQALQHAERQIVLVLDDLHEVTSPTVHAGLLRLIERPLTVLALVVTTRRDPPWPLARLRLNGRIAELRDEDLAFDDDEATLLFERLGVPATREQVEEMVARTEGWAAGLRLAALDMESSGDLAGAVAAFSGDDHSVSDYLLEEVLGRQPPELVAFLRTVSVVDPVCADLADALTDGTDGAAVLAELSASHLFVQALGGPGRWYRLHRMILDVLRALPAPRRERRDLHRRAAEWFRDSGRPLDALRSAVHGGLWSLAADLVGAHLVPLALRGSARELERVLADVPYPVLVERPELATGLAGARAAQGRTVDVQRLQDAAQLRADGLSEARQARLGVHHGMIEGARARVVGDLDAAVRAYRDVPLDVTELSRWGLADPEIVAAAVRGNLGTAEFWIGDLEVAEEHLLEAADPGSGTPALPHLNASAHLALLACEHGELDTSEGRARAVVTAAAAEGWSRAPQVGPAYLAIARVLLDRGEPAKTDVWLGRLADVVEAAPEPHVLLSQSLVLAARRDAGGDTEGALGGLRAATVRLERWTTPPRALTEQALLREADLLARAGDAGAARALAERLGPPSTDSGLVLAARLRLRLEEPDAAAGLIAAATCRRPRIQAGAGIVTTLLAAAAGDEDGALAHLESALLAAAPFGLRGPFLAEPELAVPMANRVERGTAAPAFALDLLDRMSRGDTGEPGERHIVIEPLTERERTMLRYLGSALSNAEIAAELYVSVNTVKSHQRAVYRKLGAVGRRDAVRRARVLALL